MSELTPEKQEKLEKHDDLIKENAELKTGKQQSEEERDKLKKETEEQKEELIKAFVEIIGKEETEELTKKPVVEVINEVKSKVKEVIETQKKTIETVESNNKLLKNDVESQKYFVKSREDAIKQALGIESDIDLSEKEDWEKDLIAKVNSSKELTTKINEVNNELANTKSKLEQVTKVKEEAVVKRRELLEQIKTNSDEILEYKRNLKNLDDQLATKDKEKDVALAQKQKEISDLKGKVLTSNNSSLKHKKQNNDLTLKIKGLDEEIKGLAKKLSELEAQKNEQERDYSTKLEEFVETKERLEKEKEEMNKKSDEEYEKLVNDYNELVKKNKDAETTPNLPIVRPSEEDKSKLEGFLQNYMNYLQVNVEEVKSIVDEQKDEEEKKE